METYLKVFKAVTGKKRRGTMDSENKENKKVEVINVTVIDVMAIMTIFLMICAFCTNFFTVNINI